MVPDQHLTVDTRVHDLETIRRACYSMSDRCAFHLDQIDEGHVRVSCQPVGSDTLPDGFVKTFENTLIDFGIRATLARETAVIRDLIYRQAFVEADL